MTAVTRRAELRFNASSVISSSIRLSLTGYDVDWMTKTSSPRTFSWISTKISMSEKRRTLALVNGRLRYVEMASASGRLLLQVRIFMRDFNKLTLARTAGLARAERGGQYQSELGL